MAKNNNFGWNFIGRMAKNVNFGGKLFWRIFSESAKSAKISSLKVYFAATKNDPCVLRGNHDVIGLLLRGTDQGIPSKMLVSFKIFANRLHQVLYRQNFIHVPHGETNCHISTYYCFGRYGRV